MSRAKFPRRTRGHYTSASLRRLGKGVRAYVFGVPRSPRPGSLLPSCFHRRPPGADRAQSGRTPLLSVDDITAIVSHGPPRPKVYPPGLPWHRADNPLPTWADLARGGISGQIGVLNHRVEALHGIIKHWQGRSLRRPRPPAPPRRSRRGVAAARLLPQSWTTAAAGRPARPGVRDGRECAE